MSDRTTPGELLMRTGEALALTCESEAEWYEAVARAFLDACARDGVAGYVVEPVAVVGDRQEALERRALDALHRNGPTKKRDLQIAIGGRMGRGVFANVLRSLTRRGAVVVDAEGVVRLANVAGMLAQKTA